jgi:hypothetical protein
MPKGGASHSHRHTISRTHYRPGHSFGARARFGRIVGKGLLNVRVLTVPMITAPFF